MYKRNKCIYNRYVQFKILHDRLNTRQLLCKMKIFDCYYCLYCLTEIDTTAHALIDCPFTALLWRDIELWLRGNVDTHIKILNKEKIFGYQDKDPDAYIINLLIISTKIVIYKRRTEKGELRNNEVLRFTYNDMIDDECECELSQKTELFEYR